MGLDMYFYKKGFVQLDEYGRSRNRELFDYITEEQFKNVSYEV